MSENANEQQLVEETKSALLEAIKDAAEKHAGERALNLAQAYAAIVTAHSPVGGWEAIAYADERLKSRR